jgi:hypothetical protein
MNQKDELVEHKTYHINNKLKSHYFTKNNVKEGEYKIYWINGQLQYFYFYKNNLKNGKSISYYQDGELLVYGYYKNDKFVGKLKTFHNTGMLCEYRYIFSFNKFININFKIEFILLKLKDILKSKYKKPRYELLDKYFIKDITNIISSYVFTLSKLNTNCKRILI